MNKSLDNYVKSEDLFTSLNKENSPVIDRNFQVKPDSTLEKLIRGFEQFYKDYDKIRTSNCMDEISFPDNYNSKDIEKFLYMLKIYENYGNFNYLSGLFISGLINKCKDDKFIIPTRHLNNLIDRIGHQNEGKTIIINGNIGSNVGLSMENGIIEINGNAGSYLGCWMYNGKIIVNGNAGNYTGSRLNGGEIHINGFINNLSEHIFKGKIYQYNKLIIKDGRKVGEINE